MIRTVKKTLSYIKKNGLKKTAMRFLFHKPVQAITLKEVNVEKPFLAGASESFKTNPQFSIIVPLYNTSLPFLKAMIDSVIKQTYPYWQLCLADGSDQAHPEVGALCQQYSLNDRRIVYQKLCKNEGIASNSNAAAAMATGDYLALLDHDDFYTEDALLCLARAVERHEPDVLYSDEGKATKNGQKTRRPFYKPDWSPDLIYSQMYVGHLLAFRRELFWSVGGFDKDFSGSQDYDLLLRLSERTTRIFHIPKVLYFWREADTSTASDPNQKPYAHLAGLKALDRHLKLKYDGIAFAEESEYPYVYRARFSTLRDTPKISILLLAHSEDKAEMSMTAIRENTHYKNYELFPIQSETTSQNESYESHGFKVIRDCINKIEGEIAVLIDEGLFPENGEWLELLCENALRKETGAVGPLVLTQYGKILHAGLVLNENNTWQSPYKGESYDHFAPFFVSPAVSRNVLGLAGCIAVEKKKLLRLENCRNIQDCCVKLYQLGYYNLFLPYSKLVAVENFCIERKSSFGAADSFFSPNLSIREKKVKLKELYL